MINWTSKNRIEIDGTSFKVAGWGSPLSKELQIMKEPFHITCYENLAAEVKTDSNIVELGIRTGASTAFFSMLFKPQKLSAIEIADSASEAFGEFMSTHSQAACISTHFNSDQGDVGMLKEILKKDFGDELLDVVIDDTSHNFIPSLVSFNVLFPRLKPGGIFVIEDWSWEHFSESGGGPDYMVEKTTGFARLVLMATLASAYRPGIITKVVLQRGIAVIYRGQESLDPESFDINEQLGERGHALLASVPAVPFA